MKIQKIKIKENFMNIKEVLKNLCALEAPSGREVVDENTLKDIIMPYFDTCTKLNCNSYLFAKKCGKENAPRILLDSHFDQIGLIVTGVSDNGFLSFSTLGGLDVRTLLSSKVKVFGKDSEITGVVCSKNVKPTPLKIENLLIETDLTKKELEELGIGVGSAGTLCGETITLSENVYTDRSLDNRASTAAIMYAVYLLKEKKIECDVYMLLSSQEESHGAGAKTGTYFVDPEKAIVVDVDFGATPETDKKDTFVLSKGPSISYSLQCDRKMTKKLIAISKEKEIPANPVLNPTSTGTNGGTVTFSTGVPTAVLGIPLKNMHTVFETIDVRDIEHTGKLISEYILSEYSVKEEV